MFTDRVIGEPKPPTSPLAVTFKKANSSIPQIVIESEQQSSPYSTNQAEYKAPETPKQMKDPVRMLIDADYSSHDHEPSIFSSPSLYSLHSEVSIQQENTKKVCKY